MHSRAPIAIVTAGVLMAGCASTRSTELPRTANEELLMSKAVDDATAQIKPTVASDSVMFVDDSDFKAESDRQYAINDRLLECTYQLPPERRDADTIAAIRSGALSIHRQDKLWFGIPHVTLPVPLAGPLTTPGLDLFRTVERTGVAKFGLSCYDAER